MNDKELDYNDLPTEKQEQIDAECDYNNEYDMYCEYENNAFKEQELIDEEKDNNETLQLLYLVLNEREKDMLNMYFGRDPNAFCHGIIFASK